MELIRQMHKPNIAIMPIGGHYTMGPAGAARAAKLLDVRTVVPVHYGTFPILAGTPDQLRAEAGSIGARFDVVAPERGVATPLP
jgi:L-ascorbate metabolism protein UlaG (beta-lactamase superfamily)